MRQENLLNEENTEINIEAETKKKQVARGALEMRLMALISRHPKGMSAPPLVTAAINMGSNEKSAKQCLRRLVKTGKLQRTHRGWKISQEGQMIPTTPVAKKPLKREPPSRVVLEPVPEPVPEPAPEPAPDRDLELAVALLEIKTLSKERQDRVQYLASLLVAKKIRVF